MNMTLLSKIIEFLNKILNWFTTDKKKKLPYTDVCIGDHKNDKIAVAILAKIVLQENTQPHIDEFLKRINSVKPFCPVCGLELSWIYDSGGIGVFQTGYECKKCHTKIQGTEKDLIKVLRGIVRNNYDGAWKKYQDKIREMTKGKERKYKLYSL